MGLHLPNILLASILNKIFKKILIACENLRNEIYCTMIDMRVMIPYYDVMEYKFMLYLDITVNYKGFQNNKSFNRHFQSYE